MLQNCHLNHTLKVGTTIQFPHVFDTESLKNTYLHNMCTKDLENEEETLRTYF